MGERIDLSLFSPIDHYRFPIRSSNLPLDTHSFQLNEVYQAKRIIGKGGFGFVYEVSDNKNQVFALKRVSREKQGIPCLMEASLMASYQHPHLSLAQHIEVLDGELYILQEMAQCDLEGWCNLNRPTRNKVKQILYAVAQALHFLHRNGVIHGDVKLQNVLVYSHDDFRLGDFSVSSLKEWRSDLKICTRSHRPIEGWEGEWSESVDVWALGCFLHQLIFGEKLFPEQIKDDDPINDKNRSVAAILEWASATKQECPLLPLIHDFERPRIAARINSQDELVVLMRTMLLVDPRRRPTIQQLIDNVMFENKKLESGTINRLKVLRVKRPKKNQKVLFVSPPRTLNIIANNSSSPLALAQHVSSPGILSVAEQLYRRYLQQGGLADSSEEDRNYLRETVIWMAQKIVREDRATCYKLPKTTKGLKFDRICEVERDICRRLKFMLH